MQKTSKPIIFFGTEDFSAASLTALIKAGFAIHAVVTKPDSRRGRGQKITQPLIKQIALQHGILVWQPRKILEILPLLQSLDAPTGVLVSFGKILPQSLINCFKPGIINVHPSLLPKYRGPSPIESAILHGDTETGISIMQLTQAMDAGPVYTQVEYPLRQTETAADLYMTLGEIGSQILVDTLPTIQSGDLLPTPQNEKQATYCAMLSKDDGLLSPQTMTAQECQRKVRAYILYPKTRATLYGQLCTLVEARVAETARPSELNLVCKDGKFLIIEKLIAANGKSMSGEAFLRGYKKIKLRSYHGCS